MLSIWVRRRKQIKFEKQNVSMVVQAGPDTSEMGEALLDL